MPGVQPFSIRIDPAVINALRTRLRASRPTPPLGGAPWQLGTDLDYLAPLVSRWATDFDWAAQEHELNTFPHRVVDLDGTRIHFVHQRAANGHGIPLLLTHGWPSTFADYLPVLARLTDPEAYGIDGPSFDVIVPSLPGYIFSERPPRTPATIAGTANPTGSTGTGYRDVAELWAKLMEALGYRTYGVGGEDFGAGVSTALALAYPDRVIGVHLTHLEFPPFLGEGARPLSPAEVEYRRASTVALTGGGGYAAIQSTRPQTLAVALSDSPVGLAAWILDKWHAWTDHRGDFAGCLNPDVLLRTLTLYWATNSIGTSMLDYYDNVQMPITLGPDERVEPPTAIAMFRNYTPPLPVPPREWAERLYNVTRFTVFDRGGHFAPVEQPDAVARDISAHFASLGGTAT